MKGTKAKKGIYIKFNSKEIELLKDCINEDRIDLRGIFFSKNGKDIVSTDGKRLMILHKDFDLSCRGRFIQLRFPFNKSDTIILDLENSRWIVGVDLLITLKGFVVSSKNKIIHYFDAEDAGGTFPDYELVIPKEKPVIIRRFNTSIMPKDIQGDFHYYKHESSPISIKIKKKSNEYLEVDATCLVMPMKIEGF